MLAGQLITGAWLSFTVTVKLHEEVLPATSVVVQVTVVVPFEKVEPEGGSQTKVTPEQLSLIVGAV